MSRLDIIDRYDMSPEEIYGDRLGGYTGRRCPDTGYIDAPTDWAKCGHPQCSEEFDADLEDGGARCGSCGVGICDNHAHRVPEGGRKPWCADCVKGWLDDEAALPQAEQHQEARAWLRDIGANAGLPFFGAALPTREERLAKLQAEMAAHLAEDEEDAQW